MLFSSFEFLFCFLPVVLVLFYTLQRYYPVDKIKLFLFFSSLFFYGWWDLKYLVIILLSIFLNYSLSFYIRSHSCTKLRKYLTTLGVIFNLIALGYFKYSYFLAINLNTLFDISIAISKIALPLGISFFTFQQISFLIDSFQKKVKQDTFLNYCLFVTFFPQLIAGPIVHHSEMMPQFNKVNLKKLNYKNIQSGLLLFSIGIFKKIAIADQLSPYVTSGFNNSVALGFVEAWFTSIAYTIQIYFDFSGYSDMALALALFFNIKLPINFNSPYKATNIKEFWDRWHITLSRFLRDYIYIPLGGNRLGKKKAAFNVFITFLIGGIWHGAGWTFILWGLLHGLASLIHRFLPEKYKLNRYCSWLLTFVFINFTWVFFRAENLTSASKLISSMIMLYSIDLHSEVSFLKDKGALTLCLLVIILISYRVKNSNQIVSSFQPNLKYSALIIFNSFVSLYLIFFGGAPTKFLYFDF